MYCAGNSVKLVDPDGNGWFVVTNEDGSTAIKYHSKINSEEDVAKYLGSKATFLGMTYEQRCTDGKQYYYSLFGEIVDESVVLDGSNLNRSDLLKSVDEFVLSTIQHRAPERSFDILSYCDSFFSTYENQYWFSGKQRCFFGTANFIFNVFEDKRSMSADHIEWADGLKRYGGMDSSHEVWGYQVRFKNKHNADIFVLSFGSKVGKSNYYNFVKRFNNMWNSFNKKKQ